MPWSESEYGRAICDGCCAASKAANLTGRKHLKEIGAYVPKGNGSEVIYCPICIMTKPEAFGGQTSHSMTWDMAETFFESHWYTPVQLLELGYTTRMVHGEARPTHAMSSAGAVHVHVHIPQGCLSPDCDGKGKPPEGTPLESRLARGSGPAGLWSHADFKKKRRPSATGQTSTWRTRTSRSRNFDGWTRELRERMVGVNALHLELAHPTLQGKCELELGRKSPQRTRQWYLAALAELKQATFPPRWSQDSTREPQDVNSDSGSSVASSVAARRFWMSVCGCDSSEEDEPCEHAPKCSSLTLGSDDGNKSVGSTSSVAESAIERPVSAKFTGSSLEWPSGGSACQRLLSPILLQSLLHMWAQHEWDSPLRPLPALPSFETEPLRPLPALPSFETEDGADNDSDCNDEESLTIMTAGSCVAGNEQVPAGILP